MYESYEVLVRVAEAHATADTTLEERSRTREVEGYHALVLVPDVNHAVELVVTRVYIIYIKQGIPVLTEFGKSLVNLLSGVELGDERMSLFLIDDLRSAEFLVLFVFDVAKEEHKVLALARLQCYLDIVRGDGAPAMSVTVAGFALHHYLWVGKLIVQANKGLAIGIIALYLCVHMIERIVVAALAVLGLVIDG